MGQLETSKQLQQLAKILNWSQNDIREFCASIEAVNREMRDTPTSMLSKEPIQTPDNKTSLNAEIADLLIKLGVRRNIKGYRYLQIAIEMVFDDFNVIDAITNELYPSIARKYSTTSSIVEHCIRHAIETAWIRSTPLQDELFGYSINLSSRKPTNKEFIATVADYLRQKHGKTY